MTTAKVNCPSEARRLMDRLDADQLAEFNRFLRFCLERVNSNESAAEVFQSWQSCRRQESEQAREEGGEASE